MDGRLNILSYIAVSITILCVWYFFEVSKAKYQIYKISNLNENEDFMDFEKKEEGKEDSKEGSKEGKEEAKEEAKEESSEGSQGSQGSESTWFDKSLTIYDEFYANIYDELTGQTQRTKTKVELCINIWNSQDPISTWSILDAGCGTGVASCYLAKKGAGNIIALDHSAPMISYAQKETTKKLELTDKEIANIRWRQDSLINSRACAAGEVTHIVVFYFTFYYMKDQEEFLRHLNFWSKPGAKLALEVVNKYKFDPILESASPFVGFSLQKYSKERIRKSKVTFDKFDYEAEFMLSGDKGEFYETFRFKNKHVRRQKHIFNMPEIKKIVKMAELAGWNYKGYQDLNPIGFEYGYLLFLEKN